MPWNQSIPTRDDTEAIMTMLELANELRQRAIDFRKNASGADDRDPRVDNAIAAILDDYAKDLSALHSKSFEQIEAEEREHWDPAKQFIQS